MFEVSYAGSTYYNQAGNYLHAAILAMREHKRESTGDFRVTNLETMHEEVIPLREVINILALSSEYEEDKLNEETEGDLSPNCDIMLFANDPLVE